MKGISVTSAYPVTWMKKEWNPQEERMAKEVDVVYFHEAHAVKEWVTRLGTSSIQSKKGSGLVSSGSSVGRTEPVTATHITAACHDEEVARVAKEHGFRDVFYAKNSDTKGLTETVLKAADFMKGLTPANT